MDQNDRISIVPGPDGKVTILHGQTQAFQFLNHAFTTNVTDSFLDLIRRKGSPEGTVITFTPGSILAILDDRVVDRPQDEVKHTFERDPYLAGWLSICGKPMLQKDFVKFLQNRPSKERCDVEPLLAAVSNLSVATEISGEYSCDDNQNMVFAFKSKGKEGTAKVPQTIELTTLVINEGESVVRVQFELEFRVPKSSDEKPAFVVSCPRWELYWREAVDAEIQKIRRELEGYLILSGGVRQFNQQV